MWPGHDPEGRGMHASRLTGRFGTVREVSRWTPSGPTAELPLQSDNHSLLTAYGCIILPDVLLALIKTI